MSTIKTLLVGSLFLIFGLSCSSDEKTARVEVWLTDAPGDYDEVNVDVQEVLVHVGEGEAESGWKSLPISNKGVYNLLDLTGGIDTLLGSIELPAGKISQVRLRLGDNNSIKIGDQTYDLKTPSAQHSGLKIKVNHVLVDGIVYKVLLDFDAARSIVHTGKGSDKYLLKPVIRSITQAQGGSIKGIVSPAESSPAIYAIMGNDTIGSAYSDESGKFIVKGLDPGTYEVSFVPDTTFHALQLSDVVVSTGVVTNLDTVKIAH